MDPLEVLLADAERAAREGRAENACELYWSVLRIAPEDPRALNALGNRALATGDVTSACALFRRALASDPGAAPVWLNLAIALRAAGQDIAELGALEQALAADPYFLLALLQKAQWLERHGRLEEAIRPYRSLLDAVPSTEQLPPAMRAALDHGRELISAQQARTDREIHAALGERTIESERFRHCLDVLAGRRKVYVSQPMGLHFPYLPAVQFFDRSLFPWFATLEAETSAIREELIGLLSDGVHGVPYVRVAAGEPVNQWGKLNHSSDWSALFLWKDGRPIDEIVERCPRTADVLRALPLLDIEQRAPTVMFSTLKPNTRIPPHTGVTNTRAVVHLPLIVPPDCAFRVGSETRSWREGEAWAFDDTIEHEAWNDSAETRIILIVDVWNPYLDEEERALLRMTDEVLQRQASV